MRLQRRGLVLFLVFVSLILITYYFNKNSFNNKVPRSAKLVWPLENIEVIPGEDKYMHLIF